MVLTLIARFHAREGMEAEVATVLAEQVVKVRLEPGCLVIDAYRATREGRLFFIVSHWEDEAAFDVHAELPATLAFIAKMEALIDHPFDSARAAQIA